MLDGDKALRAPPLHPPSSPHPPSGADRKARWAGSQQRLGEARELAEQGPRVARVDDLLDPEGLGGAERRAQLVQPGLDRLERGVAVRGGLELGAVGRLDAAF